MIGRKNAPLAKSRLEFYSRPESSGSSLEIYFMRENADCIAVQFDSSDTACETPAGKKNIRRHEKARERVRCVGFRADCSTLKCSSRVSIKAY